MYHLDHVSGVKPVLKMTLNSDCKYGIKQCSHV